MTEAHRISLRLRALPEPEMQAMVMAEVLLGREPKAAVAIIRELMSHGHVVVPLARAIDRLPYDVRSALYEAAKSADTPEVARLLFEVPRPEPLPIEDRRTLTLGERKSLARGSRRETLQSLLRDADAQVIQILLGNPHLTERDVVAVAARRPARADVLRSVFDSRWVTRYAVKLALCLNPDCPLDVALRLLGALAPADLRRAAHDPRVGEALRQQAHRLLATSSR